MCDCNSFNSAHRIMEMRLSDKCLFVLSRKWRQRTFFIFLFWKWLRQGGVTDSSSDRTNSKEGGMITNLRRKLVLFFKWSIYRKASLVGDKPYKRLLLYKTKILFSCSWWFWTISFIKTGCIFKTFPLYLEIFLYDVLIKY